MSGSEAKQQKLSDLLRADIKDKVEIFEVPEGGRPEGNPDYTILVTDDLSPEKVLEMAISNGYYQVVQRSNTEFDKELNTSALMLIDQDNFIENPISCVLDPHNTSEDREQELTLLNLDFDKVAEKHSLLDTIEKELEKIARSSSFRSEVLSILDELITNAVFNAPFVSEENNHAGADRQDHSIKMDKGKSANVFAGADDKRLVVGVADPYGTLNIYKLIEKVKSCYDNGVADNINLQGSGGAGIGSFMVYNACASYYAAVKDGFATMIVCAMPIKMSSSKRAQLPKNLHFFTV